MKTWIWPISWWLELRALRDENAALRAALQDAAKTIRDKDHELAAQTISHTGEVAAHVAAMTVLMQESQARYRKEIDSRFLFK